MKIEALRQEDLHLLKLLQPSDWDDILIPHQWYLSSPACTPLKILLDDTIAGIGTIIRHADTAWLAHIIVHPEFRNKGLGRTITQALVDRVERDKYQTIYLIATDFGYPVYLKVGFIEEMQYVHMVRNAAFIQPGIAAAIIPYSENYRDAIFELDQYVSGEDRHQKLEETIVATQLYLTEGKLTGVYFPTLANGMIIATDTTAGIELTKKRMLDKEFAILPVENQAAISYLEMNGYTETKRSTRMYIGKKRNWNPSNLYNRISGQLG